MSHPNTSSSSHFWHERGFILMLSALLRDTLALTLLGLAGLITLETLLPGFISIRINLALPLAGTALLTLALIGLDHRYHISLPDTTKTPRWLIILGLLWLFALTTLALLKFPLAIIITLLILTASSLWFLSKSFSEK